MLYPYYTMLYGTLAGTYQSISMSNFSQFSNVTALADMNMLIGTTYCMGRMVLVSDISPSKILLTMIYDINTRYFKQQ